MTDGDLAGCLAVAVLLRVGRAGSCARPLLRVVARLHAGAEEPVQPSNLLLGLALTLVLLLESA
jgi:hypothetical protein